MNLYSLPPLLTLLAFGALGLLVALRGPRTRVNRLFQLLCLLGCLLYIDILILFNTSSATVALWSSRVDHLFIVYAIPLYLHFFHAFLGIAARRWLLGAAYAAAVAMMGVALTPLGIESVQRYAFGFYGRGGRLYPLIASAALLATTYCLVKLYGALKRAADGPQRRRLQYVLAGFGVMGLLNGLNVLPLLGYPLYPPGCFSFIPLLLFAFGLFRHDLLDMGLLLKKSVLYSLLTACLTGLYALLVTVADRLFTTTADNAAVMSTVFFFLVVTLVFGPLQAGVQKSVDRLFDKSRYAYRRTIKTASRTIASVLEFEQLGDLVIGTIVKAMHIRNGALYLPAATGDAFSAYPIAAEGRGTIGGERPLVRLLRQKRRPLLKARLQAQSPSAAMAAVLADMTRLEADLVLPLVFKTRLNGFIALGEKRSGDFFSREDRDLLETLASQSALAVENACAYQKIATLNRDLEKRVAERTQALTAALREKELAQDQLIRSESLAAVGQLVAGAAHELNNPLASVTSLLQTTVEDLRRWKSGDPPDDTLIDDLVFADKELGRARAIVGSLLGLSRQTQTYTEAVDLNTVVADALRVLSGRYRRPDLLIVESFAAQLPAVDGNFAHLGQVAVNLIKNAMQALEGRTGRIDLKTDYDALAGQVVFECKDNGPGVAPEIRRAIFNPFFTTKEVGRGTGLGLYLSAEIIARHRGELLLEAPQGPGASFCLRLPVREAAACAADVASDRLTLPSG